MKKIRLAFVVLISAIVGASVTFLYLSYAQKQINIDWQQLSVGSDGHHGITYNGDALLESDISLPDLKGLQGKAKFIAESNSSNEVQLGYIISLTIDNLDVSKLPEKYRKQRVEKHKGGDVTWLPTDQVVYETHFIFTLKDKDGFDIMSLTSKPENIFSGKENRFQSMLEQKVPASLAKRTRQIVFYLSVDKCVTCQ